MHTLPDEEVGKWVHVELGPRPVLGPGAGFSLRVVGYDNLSRVSRAGIPRFHPYPLGLYMTCKRLLQRDLCWLGTGGLPKG